jgi:hypothetical protein
MLGVLVGDRRPHPHQRGLGLLGLDGAAQPEPGITGSTVRLPPAY